MSLFGVVTFCICVPAVLTFVALVLLLIVFKILRCVLGG